MDLAWRHSYCGLFSLEREGVTWYFLDNEQYFRRPELYGYMDDGERFGFFSRAVVRMLGHFKFWPDVIHCNDWQTALVPIYLKDDGVREDRLRVSKQPSPSIILNTRAVMARRPWETCSAWTTAGRTTAPS